MIVIPAIDVRGGRVVRLVRGRPEAETAYGDGPVEVAARFAGQGATWIHVVDLDAALGTGENAEAVRAVVEGAGVPVQMGGGLRSVDAVERILDAGAARAVLGTGAVQDARFLSEAVGRFGDQVVVALDTDGSRVLVRGWTEEAGSLEGTLERLTVAGVPRFQVTAVDRDGTGLGPDTDLYRRVVPLTDRPVIASGGVASADDLRALAATGAEAAVVGRALYEGGLSLPEAMAAVEVRP